MSDQFSTVYYREFSTGSDAVRPDFYRPDSVLSGGPAAWSWKFRAFKFVVDKLSAMLALPIIGMLALILFLVNPFLNKGPVFFRQQRMGRNEKPFTMWKFRSMICAPVAARDPNAPLEEHRITFLGKFMRKSRIDELPNFINVLRGEMSLVGPRPDAYDHADHFMDKVDGYRERHRVRPGITGLAQVELGYAEGEEATSLKTKYDNIYAFRSCGRLDIYIMKRTFGVIIAGLGR